VIITLSHLGIKTDRVLGSSVDDVDVIIGGHDHILLQEPEKVENTDVLICQAGAYAKYLGRLDLVFDENGEISSYEYKIYPITEEIAESEKINEILQPYKEKMKEFQEKIVGNSPVYLDADRKNLRYGETNFGDLITDAMKSITNSDIALINSGGIRASVDKGDITYGDILSTFPFGNTIYKADISGDTLKKIMNYSLSKKGDGAFLQVSGLKVEYTEKDGKIEINSLEVNDENVESDKMYSVAIPSFVAQGGDGYSWFSEEGKNLVDTYYLLLDTVVEYLKNNNDIPEGKGRIVKLE
jgi:2',3'-cyclic-nucleotide 2'-phosphodiesterase (5'-nucleotidase family)